MQTRREFIDSAARVSAGIALAPFFSWACAGRLHEPALEAGAEGRFPLAEFSGSHREIGRGMGTQFRRPIREVFALSDEYRLCVQYSQGEGSERLRGFLEKTRQCFPQLVEELEGLAEGLDEPFMNLFAWNCRSEIDVLRRSPGCSTIAIREGRRAILAHNEDGHDVNMGRMFLVLVTPPGGIRFLSLAYPGILPGLGPSLNSRGVVQTTNYIAPVRIAEGVPRFFIGRAILEAPDLERAVELATLKERAHPWHHNLASLSERRLVSLETHPAPRFDLKEVEGVYIHTNHLVHPEMADLPEDKEYGAASSMTRYRVITEAVRRKSPENAKEAVGILSSHEGSPFSPCRHPVGEIHGATLATAVFQAPKIAMTLYYGNPCRGLAHEYTLTAQQTEKRAA